MKLVYKFYDVENHQAVSNEVYNFVVNHSNILTPSRPVYFNDVSIPGMLTHTPMLVDFLQQSSLVPEKIAVVVVAPGAKSELHVDTIDPYVRILWPVKNCAGARTKFYDIPKEFLVLNSEPAASTNTYYDISEQRDWPVLEEVELIQPIVFDASVAHAVHPAPDATENRISFTIGFDKDLSISKSVKAWFGFQR